MDSDDDESQEPTEAEVEADQLLALRTSWATLTGGASLVSPVAGAVAVAVTPIADAIATFAVQKLGRRRVEHAAETLRDAANAADQPLADFIDEAVSDDRRHELFARTLAIAQDTALRDKRRALGRALAAGVIGDDGQIDPELLFVRAVADIDEMHIRLLARLATPITLPGWTIAAITRADNGLLAALPSLLGTLQLHALITVHDPSGFYRGPGAEQISYHITDTGRKFLARLADDAA